jgi:phosphomevalonate kinase
MFGEYAVLEQGGLGLACAIAPHVRASVQESPDFSVEGRLGARGFSWKPGDDHDPGELLSGVASYLESWLSARGIDIRQLGIRPLIDSSEFVTESGEKRGFGSSAAATVALCAVVCEAAGIREPETVLEVAVHAHRSAQGGRGSAYDVVASFYGGTGLFRGGEEPEWEPVSLPWLPELSLFETGSPASSAQAVSHYTAWKMTHREDALEFLSRSNRFISRLTRAQSWEQARPLVEELAEHGVALGESIGVPAHINGEVPADSGHGVRRPGGATRHGLCKAVGAGAELVLCFDESATQTTGRCMPIEIDREGCTWH